MAQKQAGKRGGPRAGAGRPTLLGEKLEGREFGLNEAQRTWVERKATAQGVSGAAVVRGLVDKAIKGGL